MAATVLEITNAMSTAIAPVFLVSGVGILLAQMNVRYGRVIDRSRFVLSQLGGAHPPQGDKLADAERELRALYRRARFLRLTILCAVASIFCVVLCILVLFATIWLSFEMHGVVPGLFTAGLLFLVASLGILMEDFAISLHGLKREIRAVFGRNIV